MGRDRFASDVMEPLWQMIRSENPRWVSVCVLLTLLLETNTKLKNI